MSNTDSKISKNKNRRWIHVLVKVKQFLLLIRHLSCYSYITVDDLVHEVNYLIPITIWVSEWLLFNATSAIVQQYHGENKLLSMRWWWGRFILDQHAELDFYGASSLKQQSTDWHVALFGHINLIPSQPAFAFTPFLLLSGEETNTNFIFGLTRTVLELTIFRTRGELALSRYVHIHIYV